jgi:hypothetical protein
MVRFFNSETGFDSGKHTDRGKKYGTIRYVSNIGFTLTRICARCG